MVCDWQITEKKRISYFCKYEFHCVLNIIKKLFEVVQFTLFQSF